MAELLAVDLEELRALGRTLADTASTINEINVTATITMPGSPVASASARSTTTTVNAYTRIGNNVNDMSTACEWSATSYEAIDHTFSSQLTSYAAGIPR